MAYTSVLGTEFWEFESLTRYQKNNYAPLAHVVEATGLSPEKDGFDFRREYQNKLKGNNMQDVITDKDYSDWYFKYLQNQA